VKIRIEAHSPTDRYWRFHGLSIDEPLDEEFWRTQPDKIIGVTSRPAVFIWEEEFDLPAGRHTIFYGNSAYIEPARYKWFAKMYVNDNLVAEGEVGRERHLTAVVDVTGVEVPNLWLLIAVAIPLISVGGLILLHKMT